MNLRGLVTLAGLAVLVLFAVRVGSARPAVDAQILGEIRQHSQAMPKLGVKPKRTIRFVLFTGEEQGLNGLKVYVKVHEKELEKISGVLVHDSGTGKVLTIGLSGKLRGERDDRSRALFAGAGQGCWIGRADA